ncbi:hypothetical protein N9Z23_02250 [Akkermansiaceae bacterium]|nr:hypothetical protein [Akkermansiaceae bacterium]
MKSITGRSAKRKVTCLLWRDLILKVWGGCPLQCQGTMKPVRAVIRREEIE